jgi:REP element-mobilizing transposase RayT
MRNPLRRYYGRGELHFIRFSCYRRGPFLGTRRARDRFLKILDEVRAGYQFRLFGFVVMPEHVHLSRAQQDWIGPIIFAVCFGVGPSAGILAAAVL